MIKDIRKQNLKGYPNFYNTALLMLMGYEIDSVVEVGSTYPESVNQLEIFLVKKNVHFVTRVGGEIAEDEKKVDMISLNLFAKQNSVMAEKASLDVLKRVRTQVLSAYCMFNERTVQNITNFLNTQQNKKQDIDLLKENLLSGGYMLHMDNMLTQINESQRNEVKFRDTALQENLLNAKLSIANGFDNWIKTSGPRKEDITQRDSVPSDAKYIIAALKDKLDGKDITPIVDYVTERGPEKSLYAQ